MRRTAHFLFLVISLSFVLAEPVEARPQASSASSSPDTSKSSVNLATIDLAVPDSPALVILGLTPQTIIRPTSPREFATSLLNGVDQNGNFQTGVALDTAPYLLFAGRQLTIDRYRDSRLTRVFARTQLSFATNKGASEADKSVRLALGLHLTFWDQGDPRMDGDLTECFNKSLNFVGGPISPTMSPEDREKEIAKREAALKPLAEACREKARKKNWNRSSWVFGAAPSWSSTTGRTGDMRWNGGAVWTSLAYGFRGVPVLEEKAQLIVHGRYRTSEQVPDPNVKGQFFKQNSGLVGARFRIGSPDFAASVEGVFLHATVAAKPTENSYRLSFGAEHKVAENLWFALSLGGEGGRRGGNNTVFVLSAFKWGFSKKQQLSVGTH